MSTYFGDAGSSSQSRHLAPPAIQYQSNSWLRLLNNLLRWSERSLQRDSLRDLADNPHLLHDIGLTRREVIEEADKPIWR
jgi:uncharacterized protein YjiS (DUF1127 family)